MKIKLLLLAILNNVCILFSSAQAPAWEWAKGAIGGIGHKFAYSNTIDIAGNVYATGAFYSDSIHFGTITLTNSGATNADIFIVKYDPSGNVLWAQKAGGTFDDAAYGIANDAAGNVYVTGHFTSSSITFGTTTLTNGGGTDIFIVKYDAAGNVDWAKKAGTSGGDYGLGIYVDGNGNVYISGWAGGVLINKYNAGGNLVWTRTATGSIAVPSNGIAMTGDAAGSVYVTGNFNGSTITFGTTVLSNAGVSGTDAFIVKYDSSGNFRWAKSAGGINPDNGSGVSADAYGNVYLTGYFSSPSISFGTNILNNVSGPLGRDLFIVKYDTAGNELWSKSAGGILDDFGRSVCNDAGGNVYLAGSFWGPTFSIDSTTLTNMGGVDILIAKYDPSGNLLWTKTAGGPNGETPFSIAINPAGYISIAGQFTSDSLPFGTDTLVNLYTSFAQIELYVAKLASSSVGIEEYVESNGIIIYPNPARSQLYVQSERSGLNKIEVYDLLGKNIYAKQFSSTNRQATIDISKLGKSIYFVKVFTKDAVVIKKILVVE